MVAFVRQNTPEAWMRSELCCGALRVVIAEATFREEDA
jgi:hypothetical protein